jgi:hypothetical protein
MEARGTMSEESIYQKVADAIRADVSLPPEVGQHEVKIGLARAKEQGRQALAEARTEEERRAARESLAKLSRLDVQSLLLQKSGSVQDGSFPHNISRSRRI